MWRVLSSCERGSTVVEKSRASSEIWSPEQGCHNDERQVQPALEGVQGNGAREAPHQSACCVRSTIGICTTGGCYSAGVNITKLGTMNAKRSAGVASISRAVTASHPISFPVARPPPASTHLPPLQSPLPSFAITRSVVTRSTYTWFLLTDWKHVTLCLCLFHNELQGERPVLW